MDVVIIHGYSSNAQSIRKSLGNALLQANANRGPRSIADLRLHYVDYVSLDDQVQLEDVAEALYIELHSKGFLKGSGRTLRCVVHSTGGLVIRQMLKQYSWLNIHERIASIVFLAPANFGSPLAHKGKSQLGRLKTFIADYMFGRADYVSELQFGEVGEQILTDLEMASPRQWDLSDYDLFHPVHGCLYHPEGIHAVVFTGANNESPAKLIADLDGTDGVIVTSGAGLNVRRLKLNFVNPHTEKQSNNFWDNASVGRQLPSIPQLVVDNLDHGTILTDSTIAGLVLDALSAEQPVAFEQFTTRINEIAAQSNHTEPQFQQFVFNVTDDRNKPVLDYDLSFNVWSRDALRELGVDPQFGTSLRLENLSVAERQKARCIQESKAVDLALRSKVYVHSQSKQFRRFMVNVKDQIATLDQDKIVSMSIVAESGDHRIHYSTTLSNDIVIHPSKADDPVLFYPNTTTQIDVCLDRYSQPEQIVRIRF